MKTLEDLQSSQADAVRRIQSARKTDRLHHAHIIASPDAQASLELGMAVALELLAPEGEQVVPESPTYRKIAGGNHPDLIHLKPDDRKKKEQQNEMINKQKAPPCRFEFYHIVKLTLPDGKQVNLRRRGKELAALPSILGSTSRNHFGSVAFVRPHPFRSA